MPSCFVTGTDTGIGKTWVTVGMMQVLKNKGLRVSGMKPVASGAKSTKQGKRNADALLIQKYCSDKIDYQIINPYCFSQPVSPHIAARQEKNAVELNKIYACFKKLLSISEVVIVEGIGGWRVPLGDELQTAELVKSLQIPVVLVVGLRLGCINHALLSIEAIVKEGLEILGWVGVEIDLNLLWATLN